MTSAELIKKIKTVLLRNYATSAELKQTEDNEIFLTDRFPQLKKVLIELLTPQFNEFVKDNSEWYLSNVNENQSLFENLKMSLRKNEEKVPEQ